MLDKNDIEIIAGLLEKQSAEIDGRLEKQSTVNVPFFSSEKERKQVIFHLLLCLLDGCRLCIKHLQISVDFNLERPPASDARYSSVFAAV